MIHVLINGMLYIVYCVCIAELLIKGSVHVISMDPYNDGRNSQRCPLSDQQSGKYCRYSRVQSGF